MLSSLSCVISSSGIAPTQHRAVNDLRDQSSIIFSSALWPVLNWCYHTVSLSLLHHHHHHHSWLLLSSPRWYYTAVAEAPEPMRRLLLSKALNGRRGSERSASHRLQSGCVLLHFVSARIPEQGVSFQGWEREKGLMGKLCGSVTTPDLNRRSSALPLHLVNAPVQLQFTRLQQQQQEESASASASLWILPNQFVQCC